MKAINDPYGYYGYIQIGEAISSFISNRLDNHLSCYSIESLKYDEENVIKCISNKLNNEALEYIIVLFKKYNPNYTPDQLAEINNTADDMVVKLECIMAQL